MLYIRTLKTKGNSRSVQVFRYQNSMRIILKHIGSGASEEEITSLHIEITSTLSIRAFLTQCKKITDARLLNKITGREIKMRTPIPDHLKATSLKIFRPHLIGQVWKNINVCY